MSVYSYEHPLIGKVTYVTDHNPPLYGDTISFINGFEPSSQLAVVHIPQLVGKANSESNLYFHIKAHRQLQTAFAEIEKQGLLDIITQCNSVFKMRLRRPTSGYFSSLPSNHAFGLALDINQNDGEGGVSCAPLAPVFQYYGFTWGKTFSMAPDATHFEIKKFL
ncbi:M15 family metallopeptidase [Franconibacter helveticus 513]|uniref:M15 family metallopeptidase n=1 Tax=Franconibacter helveticus TaxID=357240 RepID=UPI0004265A5A|nr:M15 family metallopeptidase [Franconibacter helveticus]MDU6925288.1 M15 family metallopeptidase [Franconibacter helveticus]